MQEYALNNQNKFQNIYHSMISDLTYATPLIREIQMETEQIFALSNVDAGAGAGAGDPIQQNGDITFI